MVSVYRPGGICAAGRVEGIFGRGWGARAVWQAISVQHRGMECGPAAQGFGSTLNLEAAVVRAVLREWAHTGCSTGEKAG